MHGRGFFHAGDVSRFGLLKRLLESLPERHVIYSCGVGGVDPVAVPRAILDLTKDRLDLRLHDFFPISPSWNLLDSRGRFAGVPTPDNLDPVHRVNPDRERTKATHREWRALWSRVIDRTDLIAVFAPSGCELLTEAYPQAEAKIHLRPHCLSNMPKRLTPGGQSLGVLGGINLAKGGKVLAGLAGSTPRRIVVIGEMDGRYRMTRPHVIHGRYEKSQIHDLARQYDIGLWLIPSICPETFSFATYEALATGLPVVAFDLGAQADALRDAANGHLLGASVDDFAAISDQIEALWPAAIGPFVPMTSRAAS